MELLEIAKKRHSVRKYTGKEIEQEKLDKILEASVLGQGAGLAGNEAVGAGEHHLLFAQQDAAALLLLHHLRFHGALQGDQIGRAHV